MPPKPELEVSDEEIEAAEPVPDINELMKNPDLVAAIGAKFHKLLGGATGYIDMLPECVKRRIHALKNIQVECCKLEGKFYEEAHQLEMKYAELFKPLYEKRNEIINAKYEPTDEEAKWVEPGLGEEDEEAKDKEEKEEKTEEEKQEDDKLTEEVKDKLNLNMDENTKGIPEFWLTAMKNIELVGDMIQEHDEEVLKHLTDVKLIFTGSKDDETGEYSDMGFVLEFLFSPNEYFTNTALTKTYKMKSEPDTDDPFSFEGPDIVGCTGCKIDWKKGMNVTQKQIKKKQKHKGRGQTRVVTKTVQNDSFFNFFNPPEVPENEDDMDEESEALLAADFEIGHFFRERFIPKAVLFYSGEAIEDDSDDDEFEDEEGDDDEDDDDDEENDPDFKPEAGEKPQECQQQ